MTLKERDELLTALRAARNLAARNYETAIAVALNNHIRDLKRKDFDLCNTSSTSSS